MKGKFQMNKPLVRQGGHSPLIKGRILNRVCFVALLLAMTFAMTSVTKAQDPPTGYTVHYSFRMWDDGNHPGADSVNQNLIDIDQTIYNRKLKHDSLNTAFGYFHDTVTGYFKTDVDVLGKGTHGAFSFGTYYGAAMKFKTQNTVRMILGSTGGITLGTVEGTGSQPLYAGSVNAKDSITLAGTYGSKLILREDSDGNWLFYGSGADFIFGNTDLATWETVNAGTYKTQGTTGYLASSFGSLTLSGLFLAASSGGLVTTELKYTNITINGVTYKVLTAEP